LEDLALAMAFAAQAAIRRSTNSRLYQQTQRAYEELSQTQEQLTQAGRWRPSGGSRVAWPTTSITSSPS
jgi:hypothetical protein